MSDRTRRIRARSNVWGKFTGFWHENSSQDTDCRRASGKYRSTGPDDAA